MLDHVFATFFMGFPGVQILVLVSSIFLAIKRNKLHKRVYGLFFPIIITMCNIWLISINRTELFDDALRFSFFLSNFFLFTYAYFFHTLSLNTLILFIQINQVESLPISFCYLFGLIFHYLNTMHWEELFRGQKFMFNILLISTAIVSYLPCQYLYTLQRRKNNP